ncbi:uncharacterized protein TRUGW13939_09762 [Talaromyces rugulosus]|uniref:Uncharacterized protein n=1 Tax=Talaromyces rugulosus TaxID=121627 RepID=A0A7H8RA30_TALRU|nr:uncharacterized protein TRUGW13939_09762 [Talaromyces rugulosus]QKX62601.1 hypothetical protein TRUGW13939_09762 [Talaromyces rugulosus]
MSAPQAYNIGMLMLGISPVELGIDNKIVVKIHR